MPELPELETARKGIERAVVGNVVTAVEVFRPTVLRRTSPRRFAATLANKRVRGISRRGKALMFDLSSDWVLVFRPMLWGLLRLSRGSTVLDARTGVVLRFSSGVQLAFRELQLSTLTLYRSHEFDRDPYFVHMGNDPLSPAFTQEQFAAVCRARGTIRAILTDQKRLSGIGNLWAHEILHAARVHPGRAGASLNGPERGRLFSALRRVLRAAIRQGGEPEFFDAQGRRGRYRLAVYGRGGMRCPRGDGIIRTARAGGRPSFFCPACQH